MTSAWITRGYIRLIAAICNQALDDAELGKTGHWTKQTKNKKKPSRWVCGDNLTYPDYQIALSFLSSDVFKTYQSLITDFVNLDDEDRYTDRNDRR